MSEKAYKVLRGHEGDKFYNQGDTRTGRVDELKHLVDLKVLAEAVADNWAEFDGNFAALKVPELMAYVKAKEIDLGDLSKKADIVALLEASIAPVDGDFSTYDLVALELYARLNKIDLSDATDEAGIVEILQSSLEAPAQ